MEMNPLITRIESRRTPRRGFSLIELVLVLTIISVLSAIAVPRYAGALVRYRADAAAQRVVTDLNYARERARSTSTSVTVIFKPAQDCLSIRKVPSIDDPLTDWATDLSAKPYLADLVGTTFTGHKVTFDGYGMPDAGGKIQVDVGSEVRWIQLDPNSGKAAVQ